ncbi:MAG TPA: FAD-dependent thymidylate synthase [Thermoplasmata archaeon]|nr:FAD-dependent thymidylate synthase [Thermoplasmata archaeon]
MADAEAPMVRPSVPEADELIGVRQPVLSHGFVALVDYMGNDAAIVQAARVSYGQGTKTLRDDRALVRYLMRHQHTTPFEMVEFKFLVRLPIFVARQFIRHRTASVNEYSARYSVVPDEYEVPAAEEVRRQSTVNRQGRGEALPADVVEKFRGDLERLSKETYTAYTAALKAGVARETARLLLPVAYYTQWYWKANLHNLLHFLLLRLDPHAQEEIRLYAAEMAKIARVVAPIAYEAFEEFQLAGLTLSRREQRAVRLLMDGRPPEAACSAAGLPLVREDGQRMKTGEGVEFLAKLERIRSAE